jgi:hypothetical protein
MLRPVRPRFSGEILRDTPAGEQTGKGHEQMVSQLLVQ